MANVSKFTPVFPTVRRARPAGSSQHVRRRRSARWPLLLGALTIGASLSPAPADAAAAEYLARPADGGRIALELERGRLQRVKVRLPAHCENNHGGSWTNRLKVTLSGDLALRSGRFDITGQAPNGVSCELRGRRRGGAISGRVRLTFLDLDFVGVDDSYLCDTGTKRYRAVKRRRARQAAAGAGSRRVLSIEFGGRSWHLPHELGRISEPRMLSVMASVTRPHSSPAASTRMSGRLPMLRP
jgi:hypothetical protein